MISHRNTDKEGFIMSNITVFAASVDRPAVSDLVADYATARERAEKMGDGTSLWRVTIGDDDAGVEKIGKFGGWDCGWS